MVTFDTIYSQFLSSVPEVGDEYRNLSEEEFKKELYNLLVPAIANFQFPHISLDFEPILSESQEPMEVSGKFKEEIRQEEINVLLVLMRVEWMQSVINRESRFERYYYDANMRTHSQGNMLQQMNKRMNDIKKEARAAIYNYSRKKPDGTANTDRLKW